MTDQTENRFERRKRETRQKLRQATLDLVLEKGYDEVTVQDIVDRADLGRGTFYIHFNDKQEILWEMMEEGLAHTMEEGDRRWHEGHYPNGYLGYLLTFEHAAQNRELYRLMMGSKGSSLLTDRIANALAGFIQESVEKGEYLEQVPFPAEITAQYVVGALMRSVLWWLETENPYTPKEMADMLYTLVHGGGP